MSICSDLHKVLQHIHSGLSESCRCPRQSTLQPDNRQALRYLRSLGGPVRFAAHKSLSLRPRSLKGQSRSSQDLNLTLPTLKDCLHRSAFSWPWTSRSLLRRELNAVGTAATSLYPLTLCFRMSRRLGRRGHRTT